MLSLLEWPIGVEAVKPDYSKSSWDVFVDMAPLLPPAQILHAVEALQVGFSDGYLENLVQSRVLIEAPGSGASCVLADAAKRLEIEEARTRQITIKSRSPLAILIGHGQLQHLPQAIFLNMLSEMRQCLERVFKTAFEASQVARCLPIGVFKGSNLAMLIDHRALAGDLVLDLDVFLLVLRPRDDDSYDVVGPALWFRGFETSKGYTSLCKSLSAGHVAGGEIFHAKGSMNLSVEDQLVMGSMFTKGRNIPDFECLPFAQQLLKEPKGAVTLRLERYHFKTDIFLHDGSEILCFEGHQDCPNGVCRNKKAA